MNASKGYVYVLSNRYMPNILKIGYTCKTVKRRAWQIYKTSTGTPSPFKVEHQVETNDARALEAKVHKRLNLLRVNKGREFFCCTVPYAIEMIEREISCDFLEDKEALVNYEYEWVTYGSEINRKLIERGEEPLDVNDFGESLLNFSENIELFVDEQIKNNRRHEESIKRFIAWSVGGGL